MVPWVGLQFVIMEFPDHTHLLFLKKIHLLEIIEGVHGAKIHSLILSIRHTVWAYNTLFK